MRELRARLRVGIQCGKCAGHVRAILEEETSANADSTRLGRAGAAA